MKVLFAVSNEKISEAIIAKYPKEYKEILSSKNVYYFNAILKEIQNDKSYDRIVISEDLEPFVNASAESIDNFIFEHLDKISDEANDVKETSIIFICSERREQGSSLLNKLFSIGVYDALVKQDRNITEVCKLINKPRTKKEAKIYYRIDQSVYEPTVDNVVNEVEMQNILTHFRKLGKNTDRYTDSFNNIASQYTDEQLKIIISSLPAKVRDVLSYESEKYRALMGVSGNGKANKNIKPPEPGISINTIGKSGDVRGTIVIPSNVKSSGKVIKPVNKIAKPVADEESDKTTIEEQNEPTVKRGRGRPRKIVVNPDKPKAKRGRPRKVVGEPEQEEIEEVKVPKQEEIEEKVQYTKPVEVDGIDDLDDMFDNDDLLPGMEDESEENTETESAIKNDTDDLLAGINDDIDSLPGIDEEEDDDAVLPGFEDETTNDDNIGLDDSLPGLDDDPLQMNDEDDEMLPGMDDDSDFDLNMNEEKNSNDTLPGFEDDSIEVDDFDLGEDDILPGMDEEIETNDDILPGMNDSFEEEIDPISGNNYSNNESSIESIKPQYNYSMSNLNSLLTRDKKIVTFVGATKNGTSFLINNLALMLSMCGINTAILDMTQNRNAYYIYTDNMEERRKIAQQSIKNLEAGYADGIKINKNLTVYTALPGDKSDFKNAEAILSTLVQNHSLVLIDCDFYTPPAYFASCQEIYLVQSMDILTIQPLTAFLRDLKNKNALEPEKVRVVINKELKVRGLDTKIIVGGMARYNDPSMTVMKDLFNKDMVSCCTIPFDQNVYSKYLETMATCKVSLNGYSKQFMEKLKVLGDMVYPTLNNKKAYNPMQDASSIRGNNGLFSSNMTNTLNKMKKNR